MRSSTPYVFIHTGLIIRLLRNASGFRTSQVAGEAAKLAKNLAAVGFSVSCEGFHDLNHFVFQLKKGQDRRLTADEVESLKQIMNVVEKIVFAEAKTKLIFVVSETRFNTDHLLSAPSRMFGQGVFERLPFLTKYDVIEAFQCLIHARATAVAFHILRATESVLRAYYKQKVKRGREKTPMWGNMVAGMMARHGSDDNLLQRLDFIRVSYRNPTAHPEATYTSERAQDLVGLCIDVINSMAKALPKTAAG
ncbi:MAG: hypothetical protein HQ559_01130 [Lentisphaerae bacterium]|nr:hypothetical protein [Lentisphaerota bacterium]